MLSNPLTEAYQADLSQRLGLDVSKSRQIHPNARSGVHVVDGTRARSGTP